MRKGSAEVHDCAVILHGGVNSEYNQQQALREEPVLKRALDAAWASVSSGEPGENAVVAALRVLEECEYFDSGYGSFPNEAGQVRLDVGLMRGNGDFISIVDIPRLRYPSEVAKDLLRPGRSLMLAWNQELEKKVRTSSFETQNRYGLVDDEESMISPYALESIKRMKSQKSTGGMLSLAPANSEAQFGHDTVGVVVRDSKGKVSAGTSTGGTALKPVGRIGDSPIIGAGVFADDFVVGLSATGHGETILKSAVTGYVIAEARRHLDIDKEIFVKNPKLLESIIEAEISRMARRYPDKVAGMIAIPPHGLPSFAFNSVSLPVAWRGVDSEGNLLEKVLVATSGPRALVGNA